MGVEERRYWGGQDLILITLDRYECFSVFHHLQKDKQRKQRHSLCEARQEKTREIQTQLLHYFSKSDNKSNHHHYVTCEFCCMFSRYTISRLFCWGFTGQESTRPSVSISQQCDHLLVYLCCRQSRLSAFRVPAPLPVWVLSVVCATTWSLLVGLLKKELGHLR